MICVGPGKTCVRLGGVVGLVFLVVIVETGVPTCLWGVSIVLFNGLASGLSCFFGVVASYLGRPFGCAGGSFRPFGRRARRTVICHVRAPTTRR